MKGAYNTQLEALDRYFNHLQDFGYMRDSEVNKLLTGVLLIDSLEFFKEFITKEFIADVNRVLLNLDCCSCLIDFNELIECGECTDD